MKAKLGLLLTTILSCFILYSCMSQEQQEQALQSSEPQSVDVTVNVGGDSRAERFLGTFDQISRLSLDIDRNYGNKRVLTDFPLVNDGAKWTGTINKLIVGFDYTITGHAYKCTDCPEDSNIPEFDNYTVTTLAGQAGVSGITNGQGNSAMFFQPQDVALDKSGNIYVADRDNHLIRRIDSSGNVTTVAGSGNSGYTDAKGTSAKFNKPTGVALDNLGNVYVADYNNHLIRKIDSIGNVTTLAGIVGAQGLNNGPGSTAKFNYPTGVAVDSTGIVYVADSLNHLIRRIDSFGNVSTLAGSGTSGSTNGSDNIAKFNFPTGVAVDSSGNVYVADQNNHLIRKIDSSGNVITFAGSGS